MDFAVLYVNTFDVKHLFEFIFLPQFYDFMHKTLSGCMSVLILYYVWEKYNFFFAVLFLRKWNNIVKCIYILRIGWNI